MEELHKSIDKLPCSEAKDLLSNVMCQLNIMKESLEDRDEIIEGLISLYDETLRKNDQYLAREYKTVHIVCGEAAAGTLRVGLGFGNKVIGFPDFFAEGPIWQLHQDAGRKHRYEWLKDHLNIENNYMEEEYEQRIFKTLEELKAIPMHIPIVLWTAENAHEQAGMLYIIYLLKDKVNDVFLINSTVGFKELYEAEAEREDEFFWHTGGIESEKINSIAKNRRLHPLSAETRRKYEEEWIALAETKEVLRVWEKGTIKSVHDHYFDPIIIEQARKLHAEQEKHDFILSARLIGEVLGDLDQPIVDAFLEDRLRTLIYKGVFEIKGIPKGIRHYSVKLP